MVRRFGRIGLLAGLALGLAGCAAQTPPVEVVRFHLKQAVPTGSVAIEPFEASQGSSLEYQSYAAAVARQLQLRDYSIAPDPLQSQLVAIVDVTRTTQQTAPARSPFSIGIGGGTGGGGFGIGGGVSFPVGKAVAPESTRTAMFVQLKRRADGMVFWEGRGTLDARIGTPYASPAAAADRLAAAIFKDFPGVSGQTVTVR